MKRIVSSSARSRGADSEAGFTLTELVAGLLVASMLIVGLADITRRYAQTMGRMKETSRDLFGTYQTRLLFTDLERADPSSIEVSPNRVSARIGSRTIDARLNYLQDTRTSLKWNSTAGPREVTLSGHLAFEQLAFGAVVLSDQEGPPVGIALPVRTAPSDCQFDAVSRACR